MHHVIKTTNTPASMTISAYHGIRFRKHKSSTCELAVYYNSSDNNISQISFIVIEQMKAF